MASPSYQNTILTAGGMFLVTMFLVVTQTTAEGSAPSNGWGDQINWVTLEEGYKIAKTERKPIMLVIHKSWCGACKALKPQFAGSEEIQFLSEKFVMVNTGDDDEPAGDGDKYSPDGGYIPRVLFFDADGELLRDAYNEGGNADYKYYYSNPHSIALNMEKVHLRMSGEQEGAGAADSSNESESAQVNEVNQDDAAHTEL